MEEAVECSLVNARQLKIETAVARNSWNPQPCGKLLCDLGLRTRFGYKLRVHTLRLLGTETTVVVKPVSYWTRFAAR